LLLQAPAQFSRVFWFLSHTCPLVQTKDVNKPIAVSQYKHELPASLQNVLPSIEQLEAELATVEMIETESNDLTD
jgi:hypothetical protein